MSDYQVIETPDGPVEFPADMSDDEIMSVLNGQYSPKPKPSNLVPLISGSSDVPQLVPPEIAEKEERRRQALRVPDIDDTQPIRDQEPQGRLAAVSGTAMAGAEIGRRLGAGAGRLGEVGGAALGGAAGAAVGAYTFDRASGVPTQEAVINAAREGTIDMAFGVGIPAAAQTVKTLGRYGAGVLEIDASTTKRLMQTAEEIGAKIGVSDVTHFMPIKGAKTVLGVFPFVGTPFRKAGHQSQEAISGTFDDILNRVAPNATLSEAGIDMVDAGRKAFSEFKNVSSILFSAADDVALQSNATIPSQKIIDAATETVKRLDLPQTTGAPIPDTGGNDVTRFIESLTRISSDQLTVAEVRGLERSIGELFQNTALTGTDARRLMITKKAIEDSWADIQAGAETQNVRDAYDFAKGFYANGMKVFETSTANKFQQVDKNIWKAKAFKAGTITEDQLAQRALNLKSPQAVADLQALVGAEPVRKAFRAKLDDAVDQAIRPIQGEQGFAFNWGALEKALGLTGNSAEKEAVDLILQGTGVSVDKLYRVIELGKQLGEIPLASKFVARRAVLGGGGSAIRALTGSGLVAGMGLAGFAPTIASVALARTGANALTSQKVLSSMIGMMDDTLPNTTRYSQAARFIQFISEIEVEQEKENMVQQALSVQ